MTGGLGVDLQSGALVGCSWAVGQQMVAVQVVWDGMATGSAGGGAFVQFSFLLMLRIRGTYLRRLAFCCGFTISCNLMRLDRT